MRRRVRPTAIGTIAYGEEISTQTSYADDAITVVDTVIYSNVIAGYTMYHLVGIIKYRRKVFEYIAPNTTLHFGKSVSDNGGGVCHQAKYSTLY